MVHQESTQQLRLMCLSLQEQSRMDAGVMKQPSATGQLLVLHQAREHWASRFKPERQQGRQGRYSA
jgi:hypothetical protein